MRMARQIGVISDTHGLLRDEVKSRLRDCDMVLHAGDIGNAQVLEELRQIAQVVAVRGNMDGGAWAGELPKTECLDVEGRRIYVVHDIDTLDLNPATAGIDVVIYGHSHRPAIDRKGGVLYLNPGSAGPKRFRLPVSMAILRIRDGQVLPEIISLRG
jgi:uncharacterized protein